MEISSPKPQPTSQHLFYTNEEDNKQDVLIPTPLSPSRSDSETPSTSSMNIRDETATPPSPPTPLPVLNPEAGQGMIRSLSTGQGGTRHKTTSRFSCLKACLFCHERKIRCGGPPAGSADTTCKQCARHSRKCEYPEISLRGKGHGHRHCHCISRQPRGPGGHHRESEDRDYVPST